MDIIGGHCKVTGYVELISPAYDYAVEPCDCRLADIAQPVVGFDKRAHPLPVIGTLGEELLLLAQVGPGAKGSVTRAREDHNSYVVVVRGILEGSAHFLEGGKIGGVEDLRTVDGQCRHT